MRKKGGGGQKVYIISKIKSDVKAYIQSGGKRKYGKVYSEMGESVTLEWRPLLLALPPNVRDRL